MGVQQQMPAAGAAGYGRDDIANTRAADRARFGHCTAIDRVLNRGLQANRHKLGHQACADSIIGIAVHRMRTLIAENATEPAERAGSVELSFSVIFRRLNEIALERKTCQQQHGDEQGAQHSVHRFPRFPTGDSDSFVRVDNRRGRAHFAGTSIKDN